MKRKQVDEKVANKVYVKPIKDKKRDFVLAYFWKYGYWFAMILVLILWGTEENHVAIMAIALIIYGIYSIIIAIKPSRHFVIAMLEGSSQSQNKYSYTHDYDSIREIKRDTWIGSIFVILLGMVILITTY